MRAAVVTGAFPPSQRAVATSVKHVVDAGWRCGHELLVVAPGTPLGPASYRGVRVARPRAADSTAIARELRAFEPDVVHVADPRLLGAATMRAARAVGVPVVASQHSIGSDRWGEWWSTIADSGADLTLATCRAARDALTGAGVAASLWAPGVDADVFTPTMRVPELAQRFSRGGDLVVCHVGDVASPHVLRRLADVASLPGVRLVVARSGAAADRYRSALPQAKVLGDMSGVELAHVVASCDVLVQPRKKELDCHAVRRALAAGVPVVGMTAGGVGDVVAHEANGLLTDPRERHGLRESVRRLREDRDLVARLASRARDSVADRSWQVAVTELAETHWNALRPAAIRHSG
ncbi:glycosyltransferase [Nocardioides mangrovicus]|uniref:glycosyltransferase n=1 Tax=Nocardioides mangrovicus TaxID=2478913 RepID=UPI0011C4A696|nr:glycosyltransferase [Nocardioides mangrovicus]